MFKGMIRKTAAAIAVTAVMLSFTAAAEDITAEDEAMFTSVTADDNTLFSAGPDSEDELFSSETETGLIIDIAETLGSGLEYEGLESESVRIGGSFGFSASDSWAWTENTEDSEWESPEFSDDRLALDLSADLFFEARPDTDTKFFGSIEISGPLSIREDDETTLMVDESREFGDIIKIDELFADFNWNEDVFFRAGKQTVSMGKGYFYSPADLLSIGEIDPEDPEASLEGPLALKISVPKGMRGRYLYITADEDISSVSELAIVKLNEFVIGATEIGVGAYYRSDEPFRVTAMMSTSIFGDESIFAEALVGYESEDEQWFSQLTAGATYSGSIETDNEFTILSYMIGGQYLFNYGDEERESLITMPGDHYLTLTGSLSDIAESDVSMNATWQSNLSDGSGRLFGNIGWKLFDGMELSAGLTWLTGDPGDEFTTVISGVDSNDMVTATISASFGEGSF